MDCLTYTYKSGRTSYGRFIIVIYGVVKVERIGCFATTLVVADLVSLVRQKTAPCYHIQIKNQQFPKPMALKCSMCTRFKRHTFPPIPTCHSSRTYYLCVSIITFEAPSFISTPLYFTQFIYFLLLHVLSIDKLKMASKIQTCNVIKKTQHLLLPLW